MKPKLKLIAFIIYIALFLTVSFSKAEIVINDKGEKEVVISQRDMLKRDDVQEFIGYMVEKHKYPKEQLEEYFAKAEFKDSILLAMTRQAEKLSWDRYRKILIKEKRIADGVKFWEENKDTLERAYQKYGVNPEIIIAILGVETWYGKYKGKNEVFSSLATLSFEYPRRAKFFKSELEQFLLLTKEQGFNPLEMRGSFAGAMGIPQFISSSWRHYAVDFSNSGNNDLNKVDNAIGSVANYFAKHGWKKDEPVTQTVSVKGDNYKKLLSNKSAPKPKLTEKDFAEANVSIDKKLDKQVSLLAFNDDTDASETQFWVGYKNFYVITRYNFSTNYAMAVYQLSQEIKNRYEAKSQAS